ncbi:hypothetical protein GCM10011352_31140 [Marinobacterium zhoushanense]|uniref:Phage shock protein B n=1 Tax=Marinobacterium zhoushanense TaxID=1679163 RepID=A0ABQ1KMT4_9GAMM|nr:hypothetical protein [Marinobacterium zhoushanense]GGC02676.1 hypothetical protein GCM10011352_31140 [Marinobacterium zhoushanense]
MDQLSLFIIAVSVVLAVAFKWYLFRRIQRWIDQDLIRGLAGQDMQLHSQLMATDLSLREAGIKRAERHRRLEQLAHNFEPEHQTTVSPDQ